jgi:hypothetical protein
MLLRTFLSQSEETLAASVLAIAIYKKVESHRYGLAIYFMK